MDGSRQHPTAYRASLSGALIVACHSTPSQPSDDFNQVLLRLVSYARTRAFRARSIHTFSQAAASRRACWGVRSCRSSRRRTAPSW